MACTGLASAAFRSRANSFPASAEMRPVVDSQERASSPSSSASMHPSMSGPDGLGERDVRRQESQAAQGRLRILGGGFAADTDGPDDDATRHDGNSAVERHGMRGGEHVHGAVTE